MNTDYAQQIATTLNLKTWQAANTLSLLNEGATIPFISRYRKEKTGELDETYIGNIQAEYTKLTEIDKRRETILHTIDEQGNLTESLKKQIENAKTSQELEDIYLPYKPKKRTRANKAKEKGLEPLATKIWQQNETNPEKLAEQFVIEEVKNIEEALHGARDIIAEWINEDQKARGRIRKLFHSQALLISKITKSKEEEGEKYKDYFDWSELLKKCPSHRYLAIMRGETEGILKVKIEPNQEEAMEILQHLFIKAKNKCSEHVYTAITDSYKRLMAPSMENETKTYFKEKADDDAIKVFAENLRQLLLAPPLGQKRILAIDPGYKTGCKVVCLDEQGNLMHNENIYPHKPQEEKKQATKKVVNLLNSHNIDVIAIGNGTAGRETEEFIRNLKFDRDVSVFIVSEDGASVYSASKTAREEFPDYDVTVRGAVSIGRRLMDPLAELVKIDPKSIGVGQYQHDVDQHKLRSKLDQVIESCVNLVGVNVNTSSKHLLSYVSGLGPKLAKNLVDYRKENGAFTSREQFKKVKLMGDKAFQQSAGFLRVDISENPLDNSAVHPESYYIVERMAKDLECTIKMLIEDKELRKKINTNNYVTENVGLSSLKDIMKELEKPGRDPRKQLKIFEFDPNIKTIDDVNPGMVVPGIIKNITNFGAFVDIGIKENGLIHISNLADSYISSPSDIISLHQQVRVKVLDVDKTRRRIQLSLKGIEQQ
ncbi:MAG: Tex family protein [Bacteroidales bacterium]